MSKDIKSFPLPDINDTYDAANGIPREIFEESSIYPNADDVALEGSLNNEHRAAFDKSISAIDSTQGRVFFVDGPGGTRKTYFI
jgi:hypothetical protein